VHRSVAGDLAPAKLEAAAERQAEARLIAVCGAPPETPTPTVDRLPSLERSSADETELRAVLDEHPRLRKWDEQ
jgi:hypothetical protein